MCVKISTRKSSYFSIWCILAYFGICEKQFDIYHYVDNKIGKKFHGGRISAKNVQKAREALKAYQGGMEEFQSKLLTIKRNSNDIFVDMMENLVKKTKHEHCKRHWSKTNSLSNDVLINVQIDIQNIKKQLENQMTMLQTLSNAISDIKQKIS